MYEMVEDGLLEHEGAKKNRVYLLAKKNNWKINYGNKNRNYLIFNILGYF